MKNLILLVVIGLTSLSAMQDCTEKLPLNEGIITYTKSQIGKKVDTGECWDLANEALKLVKAKWDGKVNFGQKVDPFKDCIYPGDIIQFENVKMNHYGLKVHSFG